MRARLPVVDRCHGARSMTDPIERGFDPYKVLQVDSEAEPEVVQAAFRRLAQKWHPDLATTPEARTEAAARMVAINRAWSILGDSARRDVYDAERAGTARSGRPGAAAGTAEASARPHDPWATTHGSPGSSDRGSAPGSAPRPPEQVSRDWTSGRSSSGYTYGPSMRMADGDGAAGPPPGRPSGSVLNFGRYAGWSLGEIARRDLEYVEWLDRMPIGRPYRDEIDGILRKAGRRQSASAEATERHGLFRRR